MKMHGMYKYTLSLYACIHAYRNGYPISVYAYISIYDHDMYAEQICVSSPTTSKKRCFRGGETQNHVISETRILPKTQKHGFTEFGVILDRSENSYFDLFWTVLARNTTISKG